MTTISPETTNEVRSIKTSELTGAALDWAVAKCQGMIEDDSDPFIPVYGHSIDPDGLERPIDFSPSTEWGQGGPIIDSEMIHLNPISGALVEAWTPAPERATGEAFGNGPTSLIAAMRCYVASKLGDEITVPVELSNE